MPARTVDRPGTLARIVVAEAAARPVVPITTAPSGFEDFHAGRLGTILAEHAGGA